jgi:hypothetical protein
VYILRRVARVLAGQLCDAQLQRLLAPFHFSTSALSTALVAAGGLVASSFSLQCVRGTSFLEPNDDTDIDIFLPHESFADLASFLECHGYEQLLPTHYEPMVFYNNGGASTFDFLFCDITRIRHSITFKNQSRTVQV